MTGSEDLSGVLRQRIRQNQDADLYRFRREIAASAGPATQLDGRKVVVFCSNDYLGLAADPRVREAAKRAIDAHGLGTGASQLVSGHHRLHRELEERLADWLGRDRALLFSSGYLANSGVIPALIDGNDRVVSDALNHASLIDGIRLSRARTRIYPHADAAAAARLLAENGTGHSLLITDSIFSMDGDRAPLTELTRACIDNRAWMMVDEAHALGVAGPDGAGAICEAGLTQDEVPVMMATLGKSLGSAGAFVAGSETLIDYLIQRCRSLIYSTAPPPALAAAALAAVDIVRTEPERREHLAALIRRFRDGAGGMADWLQASDTPIQPLIVGDEKRAMQISENLLQAGFLVTAIRPPTVPAGTARLRITLSAAHSNEQVDDLLQALHVAHRAEGVS